MAEQERTEGMMMVVMMPRVIRFLSSLLQKVAVSNDVRRGGPEAHRMSVFHGLTRPTISIQGYLERIFKYANCSPSCFVVAYIYLDRFAQMQPSFPVDSFNVHRLLITSVMVAAKFLDDLYYNNAYYAKVGGISTTEMNYLEVDFLFGLGFHLNVTPTTFHSYCSHLQSEMMMLQPPLVITSPQASTLALQARSFKFQNLCFHDEETPHQQQQLAV